MDAVDIVGIGLGLVGIGISIAAMVQAGGAKKAVDQVIAKGNNQLARDDARGLLVALNEAKDVAMKRRGKASRLETVGRATAGDIQALQKAQDALATTTVETDKRLEQSLRVAANELNRALEEITATGTGWTVVVNVLQGVIPKLNTHQRKLGTDALV